MGILSSEEMEALVEIGKEYIPIVEKATDELAPILDKLFDQLSCYMREQNVKAMEYYLQNGFSRQEALLLIINAKSSLEKMTDNMGKNKK